MIPDSGSWLSQYRPRENTAIGKELNDDQAAFARLLQIGLGRSVLYLQQHPAAPYKDAILHACLHNLAYDPQCEGDRAAYMLDVIEATGELEFYRAQIFKALGDDSEDWDCFQHYAFMGLFAAQGDQAARQALYDHVTEGLPEDDWVGVDDVIDLDGIAGFCFIATLLGERALADPEFFDSDRFLRQLEERFGQERVQIELDTAAAAEPRIAAYLRVVSENQARRERASVERAAQLPLSYEEVKRIMGSRRSAPVNARRWIREASDDEVHQVAEDLLAAQERDHTLGFLRLFWWRPFPRDPAPIIDLALGDDADVRDAAIRALEEVRHSAVRACALRLFAAGERFADAAGLLRSNFEPGDQSLLLQALDSPLTDDDTHAIGLSVLDVIQSKEQSEDVPLLLRLYERGPCSMCRHWFVDCLDALGAVPDWMWAECCYDAHAELRQLARKRLERIEADHH